MVLREVFIKWLVVGILLASALAWFEARESGGAAGLLRVGTESPVRELIESELGEVPLTEGLGHDGQFAYAVGIDLTGEPLTDSGEQLAYRYRRIAYPAVASAAGLLEGDALLWGMIVVTVLSVAIATAMAAVISARAGGSEWVALAVVLNPGIWLTIALLTPDAMALALMMVAMGLVAASRSGSTSIFSVMALTKETFLATAGGLAVGLKPRRWRLFVVPTLVLVAWALWTNFRIGGGFTSGDNLTFPFGGMIDASSTWFDSYPTNEWFYLGFALASLAVGLIVALLRSGWLRWPLLAWVGMGIVSSELVWVDGNNAARVFAPVLVLVALHLGKAGRLSPRPAP